MIEKKWRKQKLRKSIAGIGTGKVTVEEPGDYIKVWRNSRAGRKNGCWKNGET